MQKSAPRLIKWQNASFTPRFAYGEQAQAAEISGLADGSQLSTGFVRLKEAEIPWTVLYDEIILVLEGSLEVRTQSDTLKAKAMDTIWLPKSTKLTYVSEQALLFYALHPASWVEDNPHIFEVKHENLSPSAK